MLRLYLLQNLYSLSDEATVTGTIDSRAFSDFCGVESSNQVPDGDTLGRFRNILVRNGVQEKLFAQVVELLQQKGLLLKTGTIVDSTIMLDRLDELKDYNYYFQFTLNPYSKDIEPNIPSKNDVIIPTFLKLSEAIGADRVIWRYNPIILSEKYTLEYHLECFEKLAHILALHARKCAFSFLDLYKNTEKNVRSLNLRPISIEDMITLAKGFHEIALGYGLKLDTCAEQIDLSDFEISHAHCIDKNIFEQFCGCPLRIDKDKNQRPECGCVASIDIGAYNTCVNGCYYCYANFNSKAAATNYTKHDPSSPLLFGTIGDDDIIKDRAMSSCKVLQQQLLI